MSNEHTDIQWNVELHEGSAIWIVGTRAGRTYTWSWDFRSIFEGAEFLDVNGGALDPGEVPPRPSAEAMEEAERIQARWNPRLGGPR